MREREEEEEEEEEREPMTAGGLCLKKKTPFFVPPFHVGVRPQPSLCVGYVALMATSHGAFPFAFPVTPRLLLKQKIPLWMRAPSALPPSWRIGWCISLGELHPGHQGGGGRKGSNTNARMEWKLPFPSPLPPLWLTQQLPLLQCWERGAT